VTATVASRPAERWLLLLFVLLVAIVSLVPIRSYDYFWHLATGRLILEQQTIPRHDPFSVGSDPSEWINGSWLFQLAAAALWKWGGHDLVIVIRALILAALFGLVVFLTARRLGTGMAIALGAVSLLGGWHRLGSRPETIGIVLAAIALALLLHGRSRLAVASYFLVTLVWVNAHPSALLAPVMAGAALLAALLVRYRPQSAPADAAPPLAMAVSCLAASMVALLINPYGMEAVVAPLRLAGQVTGGGFVNIEWLPTDPAIFPLVYAFVILAIVAAISDRLRHPLHILLLALFSYLAIRYVRNHGFFFVLFPLLAAPLVPSRLLAWVRERGAIAGWLAIVSLLVFVILRPPSLGIDNRFFPIDAVERFKRLELPGNIYNADQFGGYLIWQLYPERRVLIDGRNELYTRLLPQLARALGDGREWQAMIRDHDLRLAVEEYRSRPLEVIDAVTGQRQQTAPSLAYFPRSQWALLTFDDVAMVFARRDAFPPELLDRLEFSEFRPDSVDPRSDASDLRLWAAELARARQELGPLVRLDQAVVRLQAVGPPPR
jgi:hypothetical protein